MEFRILGPLEVVDRDRQVTLGSAKQRALLAALLLRANEIVSVDRLIDELWAESPPETAAKVVQVYVSQLRKALAEEGRLLTRPPGYLLRAEREELDVHRFEALFDEGRRALAADDVRLAAATLRQALALWRGAPLADFAFEAFAQTDISRLEERRVAALVERIEADLELGLHEDLVAELEALVAEHPLHERLRGQLMIALYRSGRQAEALQVYQDGRQVLAEELGLDPGPALQRLEQAILTQDSKLEAQGRAEPRSRPPGAGDTPEPAQRPVADDGDVTFPELVWEHYRWERERRTAGAASAATEAGYREKLARFEAREGKIVDAYWCRHEASAAALTLRRPPLVRRLLRKDSSIRLYRATDWITRDAPDIADLLFDCDALALKVVDSLHGASMETALTRIFSAQTNLLGLLERAAGRPTEAQSREAARQTRDLLDSVARTIGPLPSR